MLIFRDGRGRCRHEQCTHLEGNVLQGRATSCPLKFLDTLLYLFQSTGVIVPTPSQQMHLHIIT